MNWAIASVIRSIRSSGSFAKLFHYCRIPSLSRLHSSFPFTVLIPRLLMISLFRQYMRLCPRNFVNPKLVHITSILTVWTWSCYCWKQRRVSGACCCPVQSLVWGSEGKPFRQFINIAFKHHSLLHRRKRELSYSNQSSSPDILFFGHASSVHDLFSLSGRFQLILVEFQKIWNV